MVAVRRMLLVALLLLLLWLQNVREEGATRVCYCCVRPSNDDTKRESHCCARTYFDGKDQSVDNSATETTDIHSTTYIEPRGIVGKQLFVHQSR